MNKYDLLLILYGIAVFSLIGGGVFCLGLALKDVVKGLFRK